MVFGLNGFLGLAPNLDDVTYATSAILCTASPVTKFYVKTSGNVTYVKFPGIDSPCTANCAVAHSQMLLRGVDWSHVREVLHAVYFDRHAIS